MSVGILMDDDLTTMEDVQLRAIAEEYSCPMEKVSLEQAMTMTLRQLEGTARIQEERAYLADRAARINQAVFLHNKHMREMKP